MQSLQKRNLLPTTYLAVLSLVGSGPKHGYEINQILEERGYRNWVDIKFSSVYKALSELEKKKLITGRKSDKTTQQSKKTYSITANGLRLLRKQITECIIDPPKANSLFDLGMSAIFQLTKTEAVNALKERLLNLDSQIAFLKRNVDNIRNITRLRKNEPSQIIGGVKVSEIPENAHLGVVQALFERPYSRLKCERKWLGDLVKKIENDEAGFMFRDESRH